MSFKNEFKYYKIKNLIKILKQYFLFNNRSYPSYYYFKSNKIYIQKYENNQMEFFKNKILYYEKKL